MRIPQTPERIKEAPAQALRAVFAGVGQVLLMTERIRRRAIGQEHSHPVSTGALATREAPASPQENGAQAVTAQPDQADQVNTGATASSTAPASATKPDTADADAAKVTTAETSTTKASTTKASTAKASTAKAGTVKADPASTKASTAKTSTSKTGSAKTSSAKTSTAKAGAAKASTTGASSTKATPTAPTAKPSNAEAKPSANEAVAPAEAVVPAEAAAPAEAVEPAEAAPSETSTASVLPVPHYSELSVASLRARLRGLDIAQVRDLLTYERTHEDRANVIAMFERRIAKLEETEGADPAAG